MSKQQRAAREGPARRAVVVLDRRRGRDDARSAAADPRAGSGLKAGEDFHLAMSPERVDPGREDWTTKTTPKVLADHAGMHEARSRVYRRAIDTVIEVSTPEAAS